MKKKYDDSIDYINGYPISEVWGTYHYLAREIAPKISRAWRIGIKPFRR